MTQLTETAKIKSILAERRIIYRQVKLMKEHCPICKEMLKGDGSIMRPWNCSCGEWEYLQSIYPSVATWKIKIKAL